MAISVAVKISNKSCNTEYNVSVTLRVDTVLYTGKIKNLVKKQQFSTTVAAGRGKKKLADYLINQTGMNIMSE